MKQESNPSDERKADTKAVVKVEAKAETKVETKQPAANRTHQEPGGKHASRVE